MTTPTLSERLREIAGPAPSAQRWYDADWMLREKQRTVLVEAANEIDRLREECARLRDALQRLIDMDVAYRRGPVVEEAVEQARAALKGKP